MLLDRGFTVGASHVGRAPPAGEAMAGSCGWSTSVLGSMPERSCMWRDPSWYPSCQSKRRSRHVLYCDLSDWNLQLYGCAIGERCSMDAHGDAPSVGQQEGAVEAVEACPNHPIAEAEAEAPEAPTVQPPLDAALPDAPSDAPTDAPPTVAAEEAVQAAGEPVPSAERPSEPAGEEAAAGAQPAAAEKVKTESVAEAVKAEEGSAAAAEEPAAEDQPAAAEEVKAEPAGPAPPSDEQLQARLRELLRDADLSTVTGEERGAPFVSPGWEVAGNKGCARVCLIA
jgi:hypothetical protein